MTVKLDALPPVPLGDVTAIGPVVAPLGTVALICVPESTENAAAVPLNVTAVAPVKLVPLIVTLVPTGPLVGVKPLIEGLVDGAVLQPGSWNDPIRVSQLSSAFVVGCAS